jgi:Class II vitamin B12-dependent ribonucleotide reductase
MNPWVSGNLEEIAMEQTVLMNPSESDNVVQTPSTLDMTSTPTQHPTRSTSKRRRGLTVARRYTQAGRDVFTDVVWERRQSVITNPDGSIVFKMLGAEIPASWSQLATDIVVSKYFRKLG